MVLIIGDELDAFEPFPVQSTPVSADEKLRYGFQRLYSIFIWPIAIPCNDLFHPCVGSDVFHYVFPENCPIMDALIRRFSF